MLRAVTTKRIVSSLKTLKRTTDFKLEYLQEWTRAHGIPVSRQAASRALNDKVTQMSNDVGLGLATFIEQQSDSRFQLVDLVQKDTISDFRDADLRGLDLSGENFEGEDFTGANISEANLSGAKCKGANFFSVKAAGTNFSNADLSKTRWKKADAYSAFFVDANFSNANMTGGKFVFADFSGSVVNGAITSSHFDRMDRWNCAKFEGVDIYSFRWHANNRPIIGSMILEMFPRTRGRFVGARIQARDMRCWQLALEDMGACFPEHLIVWHERWEDLYSQGILDPHTFVQFKAETYALAVRLDNQDVDDLFAQFVDLAPDRRWQVYWNAQIFDHLKKGLRSVAKSKAELNKLGGYEDQDWYKDKTYLRPPLKPDLEPVLMRNLQRAVDKIELSADDIAEAMQKAKAI